MVFLWCESAGEQRIEKVTQIFGHKTDSSDYMSVLLELTGQLVGFPCLCLSWRPSWSQCQVAATNRPKSKKLCVKSYS